MMSTWLFISKLLKVRAMKINVNECQTIQELQINAKLIKKLSSSSLSRQSFLTWMTRNLKGETSTTWIEHSLPVNILRWSESSWFYPRAIWDLHWNPFSEENKQEFADDL